MFFSRFVLIPFCVGCSMFSSMGGSEGAHAVKVSITPNVNGENNGVQEPTGLKHISI